MTILKKVSSQNHYAKDKIQHLMYAGLNKHDPWQTYIGKYLARWKNKNGIEDLYKALHCLRHYIHCAENDFDEKRCLPPNALFELEGEK